MGSSLKPIMCIVSYLPFRFIYRMSLLRVVDFASVFIVHIFLITLAVDSMFYLAMATIALAVAFILSSSFEGVVFASFARPFDAGDVIFLVRFLASF